MAADTNTATTSKPQAVRLGRSAATGRFVLAPAGARKSTVSDKHIDAAVKSVFSKT